MTPHDQIGSELSAQALSGVEHRVCCEFGEQLSVDHADNLGGRHCSATFSVPGAWQAAVSSSVPRRRRCGSGRRFGG
jgi:hypothetical protein